jgi:hypothetical protein
LAEELLGDLLTEQSDERPKIGEEIVGHTGPVRRHIAVMSIKRFSMSCEKATS